MGWEGSPGPSVLGDDVGGGVVGEHDDVVPVAELLQDAVLLSAVEESDGDLFVRIEFHDRFAADLSDQVALGWRGGLPDLLDEVGYGILVLGDGSLEGSSVPDLDYQVPGVHAGDAGHLVVLEEFVESFSMVHVGGFLAVLPADQCPGVHLSGLVEIAGGAVVTYEREGHDEDLPFVRGIGQTLLVSAHSCRENNFAEGIGTVAEGFPFVHGSVLEDKVTASHRGYSIVKPYLIIGVSKKHPIIGVVRNPTLIV